ncbi:14527_t:CDS:2 [Entrophospora sp. SA101]|nr:14527_t:CDS:2 [Entrophospora sp. SA101]CAJ0827121.1 11209_t:CDS:2 [Entrophospora sp. SA101]
MLSDEQATAKTGYVIENDKTPVILDSMFKINILELEPEELEKFKGHH